MKLLFFTAGLFVIETGLKAQVKAQDGKTYRTVRIGNQTWMAENLNVATYRNGDPIPHVEDPKIWSNLKTGAWCYYENATESGAKYGKLYNWYAVNDPRGLAPEGWHIPSDAEWAKLAASLGKIGSSLKIKSSKGWAGGGNGTNETGFSALPGGTRSVNELFSFAGNYGYWWTSTEYNSFSAWNRFLGFNYDDIGRSTGWKQFGSSVRCMRDEDEKGLTKSSGHLNETQNETSLPASDPIKNATAFDQQNNYMTTTTIGEKVWMGKNLNVSTFRSGDPIPEARTEAEWSKAAELKRPAWCYYDNDSTNEKKYGKLYNWYAINDKRGLAPGGWHIPAEMEWAKLANDLGGERTAGAKLKSGESGFAGLLCGFRDSDGKFYNDGFAGYWWSSTESLPASAWCYTITYISDALNSSDSGNKQKGFSVRCVQD